MQRKLTLRLNTFLTHWQFILTTSFCSSTFFSNLTSSHLQGQYKPLLVTSQATSKSSKSCTGSSSTSHWGSPLRDVTERDLPRSILLQSSDTFPNPSFNWGKSWERCALETRRFEVGRSQVLVASHRTKPEEWNPMRFSENSQVEGGVFSPSLQSFWASPLGTVSPVRIHPNNPEKSQGKSSGLGFRQAAPPMVHLHRLTVMRVQTFSPCPLDRIPRLTRSPMLISSLPKWSKISDSPYKVCRPFKITCTVDWDVFLWVQSLKIA